jgi:hypothetical protein
MRTPRRRATAAALSTIFALFLACDDNDSGTTDPVIDTEAPVVAITTAPDAIAASEPVVVWFTVTDEHELEQVVVSWGTPDTPSDIIPLAGRSYAGSCTHDYEVFGEFSIVVEATDAAGHTTSETHLVTITEPPPSAPVGVSAHVLGNEVTVTWTPGSWSAHQEVTLSRPDGLEPDRVASFANEFQSSASFSDLAWGASYEVVVAAINGVGRAEGASLAFQVPLPDPPLLTRFSALAGDPTCLYAEWTAEGLGAGSIENFRLAVTGDTQGDSFEEIFPGAEREAVLCADVYPVADGMTYTAQLFASIEGQEHASNSLEFTVDFGADYTAEGRWTGEWLNAFGMPSSITLDLFEDEGVVSGSFGMWNQSGLVGTGPVTGTRTLAELDLILDSGGWTAELTGLFAGTDMIEAKLDLGLAIESVVLRRE